MSDRSRDFSAWAKTMLRESTQVRTRDETGSCQLSRL